MRSKLRLMNKRGKVQNVALLFPCDFHKYINYFNVSDSIYHNKSFNYDCVLCLWKDDTTSRLFGQIFDVRKRFLRRNRYLQQSLVDEFASLSLSIDIFISKRLFFAQAQFKSPVENYYWFSFTSSWVGKIDHSRLSAAIFVLNSIHDGCLSTFWDKFLRNRIFFEQNEIHPTWHGLFKI